MKIYKAPRSWKPGFQAKGKPVFVRLLTHRDSISKGELETLT